MPVTKEKFLPTLAKIALLAASQSRDTTKVGAVLVHDNTPIISMFNGPVPNVQDLPERLERPEKYKWCAHAEQNVIARAARLGIRTEGLALVTTHYPCASCADTVIVAGIKQVIYLTSSFGSDSAIVDGLRAASIKFEEAGVIVRRYVCTSA